MDGEEKLDLPQRAHRGLSQPRERSAPEITLGVPGGDAAFADFSILIGFTHRF